MLEIIYDEEDQAAFDAAIKAIQDFDKEFFGLAQAAGVEAHSARRQLLDSPQRQALLRTALQIRNCMVPKYVLKP